MSYKKQTWVYKDEITADKLNHMEQGIEDASQSGGTEPLIVVENSTTLDKTWREIHDALVSGRTVLVTNDQEYGDGSDPNVYTVLSAFVAGNSFRVAIVNNGNGTPQVTTYKTSDMDGYPSNKPV